MHFQYLSTRLIMVVLLFSSSVGRFDDAVIEERKKASIKLLSFVAINSEMVKHEIFAQFLVSLK